MVDITTLSSTSCSQHVHLCETLYDRMASPVAAAALRSAYIDAMCEEATCDLLCRSMETGIKRGGCTCRAFACVY